MKTCKRCGEPLKQKVRLLDREIEVDRDCACARMHEQKKRIDQQNLEKAKKRHQMVKQCFDNVAYADITFSKDEKPGCTASKIARDYALKFLDIKQNGSGLLIYGRPDASKTFYAACIANEVIDMGCSVIMDKPARIIAKVQKQGFGEDYVDKLSKVDLLILDDFGTESDSAYRQEIMYDVIDSRFKKPLIVTTNMTYEQIVSPGTMEQERLIGRILDGCMPVEFEQTNMRWSRDYSDIASKVLGG